MHKVDAFFYKKKSFLTRDTYAKRGASPRLVSVCPSVTPVYCIETAKDIKLFYRPGSPVISVFELKRLYTIPNRTLSAGR